MLLILTAHAFAMHSSRIAVYFQTWFMQQNEAVFSLDADDLSCKLSRQWEQFNIRACFPFLGCFQRYSVMFHFSHVINCN